MFLADNQRSRFLTPDLSIRGTSSSEDRRLRERDHAARRVRAPARGVRERTRGHGAGLAARAPPRVRRSRRARRTPLQERGVRLPSSPSAAFEATRSRERGNEIPR